MSRLLVGLVSDTHDRLEAIRRAVEVFNEASVGLVLHAGDYVAPFTALAFKGLRCRLIGVYGNVDGDRELLKERYAELGEIRGLLATLELEGVRIALLHGSPLELVEALAKCRDYDVVVHGHTHRPRAEKVREALVVNPGEACGYLTGRATVALLELPSLKVEHLELATR
ncbi:MAG: metallophosphoesterase [Candidatus Nezhaarchaeota archaeon]|nr:metallophosphoesterase [Candidatus Nezhaarchaeota archaeon]